MFALGAILCQILTGVPPYRELDGDPVQQAASARLDGANERLSTCGADHSLLRLCRQCLSPAKRARPESAREVADRIGAYLTSVEERARLAELHAVEVRFRQRVTLVAASAAMLLVSLGAVGWIWLQQHDQTRRAEVTQQVSNAMSLTSRELGKAQRQRDELVDVASWNAVDARAESLALLLASNDVEGELRRQAVALLTQVEFDSRRARADADGQAHDAEMAVRLETLLIPTEDDARADGFAERDLRRLDGGYALAFADYLRGASISELPIDRAVDALRGGIAVELAIAIDRWCLIRDERSRLGDDIDAERTRHLREIASRLDGGHPWRARLRALLPIAPDETEALLALAAEAERTAHSPAEYRVLAQALRQTGRTDRRIAILEHARRTYPEDFGVCFELAFGYESAGPQGLDQAQQTYRIANAIDAGHDEVLHRRGIALEGLRRWAAAERTYATLIDRDPDNQHWMRHWARVVNELGRTDEALACYRRVLASENGSSDDFAQLGEAFSQLGLLDEAAASAERAIELDGLNATAWNNLGTYLARQGELDQAIAKYRRSIQLREQQSADSARSAAAWFNLGSAQVTQRDFAEAETSFRRVLELDDQFSRANFFLAQTLEMLGEDRHAIERYQLEIEHNPSNIAAYARLGSLLDRAGDLDRAIDHYRSAVAIDGQNPAVRVMLAAGVERRGDLSGAMAQYEAVVRLLDGDSSPFAQRWLPYARQRIEVLAAATEALAGRRQVTSHEQWSAVVCALFVQCRYAEIVAQTERAQLRGLTEGDGPGLYHAACAAARQAADDGLPSSRELALSWLANYVEPCRAWIRAGGARAEEARYRLRLVLGASLLDGLRGDAVDSLPETERGAWRQLWADVIRALATDGR